jgi:serine/threonine protein kinase
MDVIRSGKRYIIGFVDELTIVNDHVLVLEHAAKGDVCELLQRGLPPELRVRALRWFKQTCLAVQYLHAHSIAHLDLTPENVCIALDDTARIIDLGAAVSHPTVDRPRLTARPASYCVLLDKPPTEECWCESCRGTVNTFLKYDCTLRDAEAAGFPIEKFQFLCRPVCLIRGTPPGKNSYIAPELARGRCWDAYRADIWSLGITMWTLLTGHNPYTIPTTVDQSFRAIFDGSWAQDVGKFGRGATRLSAAEVDLLKQMLCPCHARISIDEVLAHSCFSLCEA